MEVTTQPTGSEHAYILVDGTLVATVLNAFAEECRKAIADSVANRTHDQEEK